MGFALLLRHHPSDGGGRSSGPQFTHSWQGAWILNAHSLASNRGGEKDATDEGTMAWLPKNINGNKMRNWRPVYNYETVIMCTYANTHTICNFVYYISLWRNEKIWQWSTLIEVEYSKIVNIKTKGILYPFISFPDFSTSPRMRITSSALEIQEITWSFPLTPALSQSHDLASHASHWLLLPRTPGGGCYQCLHFPMTENRHLALGHTPT